MEPEQMEPKVKVTPRECQCSLCRRIIRKGERVWWWCHTPFCSPDCIRVVRDSYTVPGKGKPC